MNSNIVKYITAIQASILIFPHLSAQNLESYRIYNTKGREIKFSAMAQEVANADVILFGELHNNPICHWLQIELSRTLLKDGKPIVFGAEMFEADDQLPLHEFIERRITLEHFKKEVKLWPNFSTDYLPILQLAYEHKRPFIATNVPRRYASLVARRGLSALDSLSPEAQRLMGPIPFTVTADDTGYAEMRAQMGFHGPGINVDNMVAAQALKDHTMAHFIADNFKSGERFMHFHGSYHSQRYAGIYPYLKKQKPDLRISVIATVEADFLDFDETWKGLADYVLVIPSSMTKTH